MAFMKSMLLYPVFKFYWLATLFLKEVFGPLLFLLMRLWMAHIFWHSGLSKVDTWSTTLLLFENEYNVPFLPPELAAYLATITELSCPLLLVLGLATRFATIPMLIMTAVIQFTYLSADEHFYWATFLGLILCYGPGPISLDSFIWDWVEGKRKAFQV